MKIILNLEKVKDIRVFGIGDYNPKRVSLYVNYYDKETAFEYIQILKDLCQAAEIGVIEKVEKAYGEIKQALLKGEKIVEIRL